MPAKFIILLSFLCFTRAFAGPFSSLGVEKTEAWPDEFVDKLYEEIGDEWDHAGAKLSASVFRSLTNIKVLDLDTFAGGELTLRVKRKVFDNFDIKNSWTVADFFSMPLTVPLYTAPSVSISGVNLGARLSATVGIEIVNIRQVDTGSFHLIPHIDWLNKEVKESVAKLPAALFTPSREVEFSDAGEHIHIIDQQTENNSYIADLFQFWKSQNPQIIARYSDYFNLLTQPMRLPLTPNAFNRMDVNEISTYSLDGAVALGGHAGWGIEDLSIGANLTTYLLGKFRISILKEDDSVAQVKVTRRLSEGLRGSFGSRASDFVVFKGFVVRGKNILDIKEEVVPFDLSIRKEYSQSFDLGYRYDLTNPRAQSAYQRAVFGNFVMSEELARAKDGVARVFERTEQSNELVYNNKIRLAYFVENEHNASAKVARAHITLPDGEHKIITAINSNEQGYDTLWNMSESRSYRFYTTLDRDLYQNEVDDGLALRVEAKISDSRTSGKELNRYLDEVEELTGQYNLFPRAPEIDPEVKPDMYKIPYAQYPNAQIPSDNRIAQYGRTSFYYRIGFSRQQIEEFRDTPEHLKWRYLEKAFDVEEGAWDSTLKRTWWHTKYSLVTLVNIPLRLIDVYIKNGGKLIHADRFYNNWNKISGVKNPDRLIELTAKLFTTENFSVEFLKVIKHVIADEEISYFISAKSPKTFGAIVRHGKEVAYLDRIVDLANITIGFDDIGAKPILHTGKVSVGDFKVSVLPSNKVEIRFYLTEVPEFVYIRIDRTSSWQLYQQMLKLVVANRAENRELFKKGENVWVIDQNSEIPLFKMLADNFYTKSADSYKTFHMSVSMDQKNWGGVSSQRFKLK